jgi:hypothetical protein
VPVADAVEQQRPTGESPSDDEEDATSRLVENDVPLQVTVSDSQQQQPALIAPVIVSSIAAHRVSASALSWGRGDLFSWPTQIRLH